MADIERAQRLWTLEMHRFGEHIDSRFVVYAVDENPGEMFDQVSELVGEGETEREAIEEAFESVTELEHV